MTPFQPTPIIRASSAKGAVAQLGEHHAGSVRVRGSSPLCSILTRNRFAALAGIAAVLLFPASARAQAQPMDLVVTIVAVAPQLPAQCAIAYAEPLKDREIRQDLEVLAGNLRIAPLRLKIDRSHRYPTVEFEALGLVDWRTGSVNLDALVGCLRRFGAFRVICLHPLQFPESSGQVLARPPVRVETQVSPGLLDYRVWIDQSAGVPETLPVLNRPAGPDWGLVLGLASAGLGGGVALFFGVCLLLARRRAAVQVAASDPDSPAERETGEDGHTPG